MARHQDPGAGVARNMARVITDQFVKARAHLLPLEQVEKWRHTTQFLEDLEVEMAPTMAKVFGHLLENPELDDSTRTLLEEMVGPEHQFGTIVQIVGLLGAIITTLPALGQVQARGAVQLENQQLRNIPLSPADAAEAVMRNIRTMAEGQDDAGRVGMETEAFEAMTQLVGEPPGPVDMVNLWWQGRISEDELTTGLLYSRVRDDFIPMMRLLAVQPMSGADAIEATIKGVLDEEAGKAKFIRAGGMDEDWETLYQGAGDAIGTMQAIELWNQGLISEDEVTKIIGRSRINPMFYEDARLLRHKFLQPYQIMEILKAGGATPEQATEWMVNLGYSAAQATALVDAGLAPTGGKAKQETEAMVLAEYTDQILTGDQASVALVHLGYTAEAAGAMLDLADAKRELSQRNTAITAIRSAYLAQRITKAQASSDLDKLQIPVAARDAWLTAWGIEQTTKVKEFTTAQIGGLAKKGIITYDHAAQLWESQGWSSEDATLLALDYGMAPPTP